MLAALVYHPTMIGDTQGERPDRRDDSVSGPDKPNRLRQLAGAIQSATQGLWRKHDRVPPEAKPERLPRDVSMAELDSVSANEAPNFGGLLGDLLGTNPETIEQGRPIVDAAAGELPVDEAQTECDAGRKRAPSWMKPAPHHARDQAPEVLETLPRGTTTIKREALARRIMDLPSDRAWEVRIKQRVAVHSDDQRSYLWGVVYKTIAEHTGYDVNDLHDIYLGKFFGREDFDVLGVRISRPVQRSSRLTMKVYFEYTEFIRMHAEEFLGCTVPLPEPGAAARMRERLEREIANDLKAEASKQAIASPPRRDQPPMAEATARPSASAQNDLEDLVIDRDEDPSVTTLF